MSTSKIIIPIDLKRRLIVQFFSVFDPNLVSIGLAFEKAILSDILNTKLNWQLVSRPIQNIAVKDGEFIIDLCHTDKFTIINGPSFKGYDVYFINEGEHIKVTGTTGSSRHGYVSFDDLDQDSGLIVPELLDHIRKFLTTKYPLEGQNG